jgi:hypothetical protein
VKELGIKKAYDPYEKEYCDTVFEYDIRIGMNEMAMIDSMLNWFINNNKTPCFARMDIIKQMQEDFDRIKW